MRKYLLLITTIIFSFLLIPTTSLAHLGGVPFIEINSKPTLVNDYNSYSGRPDIPQDDAPETYLVNQPIKFEVIQKFLQVPEEVFKKTEFRWKFDQDSDSYETGSVLSYTFSKPKFYFVQLDVKGPDQADFQPLNTIGINIVPDKNYTLPSAKLSVRTNKNNPNSSIAYVPKINTDPSAQVISYSWDFDDQTTSTDISPTHKFADESVIHGVTLKITDTRGYVAQAGLQIFNNDGKLEISDLKPNSPPIDVDPTLSSSNPNPLVFIIPGIFVVMALGYYLIRHPKTK